MNAASVRLYNQRPPPRPARPKAILDPSLSVLVADDDHDGADSLAILLRLSGHRCTVAYGAEAALEACAEPDAFVTDIGMPKVDGVALAARVVARCRRRPLLVAMTGYADAATRERCLAAGFDRVFVKPADPLEFLAALREHAVRLAAGPS